MRAACLRVVRETLYFLAVSPKQLSSGALRGQTFGQFMAAERYSDAWLNRFALPALAGICTCSFEAVRQYPAHIVVHYVLTRSGFGVRRVCGGTEQVVERLTQGASTCGVCPLPPARPCPALPCLALP